MDAPFWESVIRFCTFLVVFASFMTVVALWVKTERLKRPLRWLIGYMSILLGGYAAYRLYVFWLGLQTDVNDTYVNIEPYIRTAGSVLVALIVVGIALMAVFHNSRLGRTDT